MQHTRPQKQLVFEYYERIANSYRQRSGQNNGYHQYFFNQRIKDALAELPDLKGKSILDVGAGTGTFYDAIQEAKSNYDYKAVDISPQMLDKSKIPKHQQLVGDILQMDFPNKSFDVIILLGVSTYLTKPEMIELFRLFERWLSPDGKIIATFTNSQSVDNCFRNMLRPFSRFLSKSKDKILQQEFQINAYKSSTLSKTIAYQLKLERIIWQNQTITPFNQLFPKISIRLATLLNKNLPDYLLSLFSADFMVVFTRIDEANKV